MTDIAIRVENLSKCYHIYDAPRDRLKQFVMPKLHRVISPLKRCLSTLHSPLTTHQGVPTYYREFWALKDLSLDAIGITTGKIRIAK